MEGQDQEEMFSVMPAPERLGHILNPSEDLFARESMLGRVARREAHRQGIWHRVIGLWLYTQSGLFLLQQRSEFKDTNPLKWAISVGGHISDGSSVVEAVLAETHEELGLKIGEEELNFIGVFAKVDVGSTSKYGFYTDSEYLFVYAVEVPEDLSLFTLEPKEVQQVQFFPIFETLDKFDAEASQFSPMCKEQTNVIRQWFKHKFP